MSEAMSMIRIPAEAFPPGETLRDELEARGWSQQDLADILGKSERLVNEIINAKRAVTPETAVALAHALGTSAEFWLNLESSYRLWLTQRTGNDPAINRRARIYAKAPVREMVRRGWIAGSKQLDALEQQVLSFFGHKTLEEKFSLPHAARKSTPYDDTTPAQAAWLTRAHQLARVVTVRNPWKTKNFSDLVSELQRLTLSAAAIQEMPRVLSEFGIRLVLVERLPQAKMFGATLWLDESGTKEPVIALAVLFDRIDHVWHTLMHEIRHVASGETSVDNEVLGRGDKPENERLADQFAVESLVPQAELDDFCLRVAPLFSEVKILGFAARIRIHPGIVVGQLHYRGSDRRGLDYTHFRKMLVPVRKFLTPMALTDGWGAVVPL